MLLRGHHSRHRPSFRKSVATRPENSTPRQRRWIEARRRGVHSSEAPQATASPPAKTIDPCDTLIEKSVGKVKTLQDVATKAIGHHTRFITPAEQIYPTSRDLNLNEMDAFGFDYDYTIANYNDSLQTLIYNLAVQHLVDEQYYPKDIAHFQYDPNFAIRGLYYDFVQGNLLKLDYLYNITPGYVYFGRQPLTTEQILQQYGGFHVNPKYQTFLRPMIDQFCLPETCLIADMIEYFKVKKVSFDPNYVYKDVNKAVDHIHRSGTLHNSISKNLPFYLEPSKFLPKFFRGLREKNKKVFLLTNSPFKFIDTGMKHMMGEQWRDNFDIVIAQAGKPDWFVNPRRPLRMLDTSTGRIMWDRVGSEFEPGKVYIEGSLNEFNKMTKLKGSNVAYFGVIIEELEHEVRTQISRTYRSTLRQLLTMEDLDRRLKMLTEDDPEAAELQTEMRAQMKEKRRIAKQMFNKYFGSVFRTHTNPTLFAYLLQRYADIYTSKLENFDLYPLDFVHKAEREFLPHEKPIQAQLLKSFEELGLSSSPLQVAASGDTTN